MRLLGPRELQDHFHGLRAGNRRSIDIGNLQVCRDDIKSLLAEGATDTYSWLCYTTKIVILGSGEGSRPHFYQVDNLGCAEKGAAH